MSFSKAKRSTVTANFTTFKAVVIDSSLIFFCGARSLAHSHNLKRGGRSKLEKVTFPIFFERKSGEISFCRDSPIMYKLAFFLNTSVQTILCKNRSLSWRNEILQVYFASVPKANVTRLHFYKTLHN